MENLVLSRRTTRPLVLCDNKLANGIIQGREDILEPLL